MTAEALAALALFAFVGSITPGPNNLMLLASGASFGLRRTVPHVLGIGLGFVVLLGAIGAGLGALLERVPTLGVALRVACVAYLAVLVHRIARAGAPGAAGDGARTARPLTLLEAAAFQWVNPKGWALAVTAISAYVPERDAATLAAATIAFGLINVTSVSTWAVAGVRLRRHLTDPLRARRFNRLMAGLLALSVVPVLLP